MLIKDNNKKSKLHMLGKPSKNSWGQLLNVLDKPSIQIHGKSLIMFFKSQNIVNNHHLGEKKGFRVWALLNINNTSRVNQTYQECNA